MLESLVSVGRPFPWQKMGRLFEPAPDGFSHGSHPCIVHIEGDQFVLAYTQRDESSRSHIFLSRALVRNGRVEMTGQSRLALAPGAPGHFDCDGAISVCFVACGGTIYLYYVGWQNLPEGLWLCDTGRAILDTELLSLRREFPGPVLGRDKTNPLFAAATAFHATPGSWKTWYNSGIRWEKTSSGWKHYYGIHYASSNDGVNWHCEPGMCIPFADEYEYAFGRPSVIRHEQTYYMWFAHRATKDVDAYRMGFAHSIDGRSWTRNDALAGLDVSPSGWDSEMVCYPCVFKHRNTFYMLYNGNEYGKTGFGFAVMDCTP